MGDDSVMECVPEGGTARAHTSWTAGNPNYGVSRENVVSILYLCIVIQMKSDIINLSINF